MKAHAILGILAALLAAPLTAQRGGLEPLTYGPAVKRAFTDVVAGANAATAVVFAGEDRVALGTVVAADGLVLTKASETTPGGIACEIDGTRYEADVVAHDEPNDLALLRVDAEDLFVAPWSKATPRPGAWLASPDGEGTPAGIGILSSAPYRRSLPRGFLGVRLVTEPGPVRLADVQEDTAAEAAGLEVDDVILALDGETMDSYRELIAEIGRRKPGETVRLRVQRAEEELELVAELRSDRRGRTSGQERLWGPLSGVRDGFGTVLQHDTVLRPEHCGGPLVDLDGKVVGINIARAGRVETLALPVATVRNALARMLGKKR